MLAVRGMLILGHDDKLTYSESVMRTSEHPSAWAARNTRMVELCERRSWCASGEGRAKDGAVQQDIMKGSRVSKPVEGMLKFDRSRVRCW